MIDIVFTGIPVTDFPAARAWYRELFGRVEDVPVAEQEVMWRITDSAWIYVVGDEQRAGRAIVALSVPDLEAVVTELGQRGIGSGPIEQVGPDALKATVRDSDGNSVSFIQVPTGG